MSIAGRCCLFSPEAFVAQTRKLNGSVSHAALSCALVAGLSHPGWAQEADDIEAAVTTNKAILVDGAMDALANTLLGNPVTSVGVGNMVLPADNPPAPILIDGIMQSSNTDNTPAVDVGAAGEVRVLNGGQVTTSGLTAPGITVDPANGALSVDITTGGTISTTGNGSAGIETGAFDTSFFNLRILGDGMSTAISTQGDNANAISLGDGTAGMSTATLGFQNTTLTTMGASSDIISAGANLSIPNAFSVSLGVETSTLTTQGGGSSVFSAANQGASDVRLSFNEATLSTAGTGSDVISYLSDDADSINVTLINSSVDATGANSRGLVFDQGSSSNATFFIGDTNVRTIGSGLFFSTASQGGLASLTIDESSFDTTGDNASAIVFGQLTGVPSGTINSATLTDVTATTQGANSEGVFMGAVGGGSARSFTASGLSVQTMGLGSTALHIEDDSSAIGTAASADIQMSSFSTMADNARGVVFGGLGATGTQILTFNTSTVSTLGNDAGALFTPGQTGDDSSFAFGAENSRLTTQGDRSIGLEVGSLQGANSDATIVFDALTIETGGTDSTGILIGSPDPGANNLLYNFTLQDSTITTTGATSDAVRHVPGTAGYTIRLDNTDLIASGMGSRGVVMDVGASSGAALFFSGTSILSSGSSIFVESDGNGSALNLTLQDSSFDTTGDSATAIVFGQVTGVPAGSVTSANLTSVDITTVGLNSEGILLGAVGNGSVTSFFVSDLTVGTTGNGSTAVRVADDSAATGGTYASDFRSSTFSTQGNGAFGIIDGGRNANSVVSLGFDDITVTTMGDDAGAYFTPGASGAGSDFTLTGSNSMLTTQGDRSVGLEVANLGGTGSDVDIDIIGTQIATSGDAAQGILIGSPEAGATNVTYALRLEDSPITTTGAMSDAMHHVQGTGQYTHRFVDSDLETTGAGSRGFVLDIGNSSSTAVFIEGSNFTTTGSSLLVKGDVTTSSLGLTVTDSQFATTEDDATAIAFGTSTIPPGGGSVSNQNLTNVTVNTSGETAEGIRVGALGGGSVRNFTADALAIETTGNGSTGLHLEDDSAAGSSVFSFDLQSSSVSTQGDNARGIVAGGLGQASTQLQTFDDITVTTLGDDAGAYFTSGAMSTGSAFMIMGSNSTLTTQGNRSIGLEVANLPETNSQATLSFDNLIIETGGEGSTGLLIGAPDTGSDNLVYELTLENTSVTTTGANAHAIQLNFASSSGADSSFEATAQLSATATGAGSDALQVTGTGDLLPFMLSIEAGDALSSADGFALLETGMHTTLDVEGTIGGDIDFGTGNDDLTFAGDALDLRNLGTVDGGAGTDTARFDNATAVFEQDVAFVNFEGPITATDTTLTLSNVTLDLNRLVMTGMSRLNATGTSTVGGDLRLSGTLSQANQQAGDRLTIDGDLSGTFAYELDAQFDAPETVDLLTVTGSTTEASGTISVSNLGGLGSDTGQEDGDGILIVDVEGASEENDFALESDVQAGAFIYGLHRSSVGDFFLQTVPGISDAGLLYSKTSELVFSAHDTLLDVPLHDGAPDPFGGAPVFSFAEQPISGPDVQPFLRAFGGVGSYDATTTRGATLESTETDFDYAGLQVGASIGVPSQSGVMAVYVAGHFMTGSQDVDRTGPRFGPAGNIDTESYGAMLGWSYALPEFGYVRAALTYSHADHDFLTAAGAVGSTSGDYVTATVEGGRHIAVSDSFTVTPWARVGYENADISGFVDSAGTVVGSYNTDQTVITVGARGTWRQNTVTAERELFAGLALSNADSTDTTFALTGVALNDRLDEDTFAELDAGVAWRGKDGRFRSRFSIASRHGLSNTDNHRLSARFDLALNF